MLHVVPSFFGNFLGIFLFNSTNKYWNFLVCRDYCVAPHDPASCILINCQFHILLIADRDRKDLIGKLDRLCSTKQHVVCYTRLFKNRISGNILVKNGEIIDFLERFLSFKKLSKRLDKTQHCEEETLRQKFKKHLLTVVQKSISVERVDQLSWTESNDQKD